MPDLVDAAQWPKGPFIQHSVVIDDFKISVPDSVLNETSLTEIYLSETLLSPMLTTIISLQDTATLFKDLETYKGAFVEMSLRNPNLPGFKLDVKQVIHRIENRAPMNYQTEAFNLHACDETLLNNARMRISHFWNCKSINDIATEVLNCVGAKAVELRGGAAKNKRNYQAANIHPFQIVAELADVSINKDNDPSLLHYMTYRKFGTHHFEALKDLVDFGVMAKFVYDEKGLDTNQIGNPRNIMQYSFPCEFDLLSDIMNGLDQDTQYQPSMTSVNPQTGEQNVINGEVGGYGCGGIGGVINASAFTNLNSSEDDGCETMIEQYMHLRPPRMALLQPDKISLKIIVPFQPQLHAGDKIEVKFYAKRDKVDDYGSGEYIIVNLIHNIKPGAANYATTTLECVSRSVERGEV